jgi:hypothetical protein
VNAALLAFYDYYLTFLNHYPEHRALAGRMSLDWRYPFGTFIFGYGPVLALAAARIRMQGLAPVLAQPRNRLLLSWAMAAIALENHDFLISPRQPIHFTRGYAWSALFLLGAPALICLFDRLMACRRGRLARMAILAIALSDNACWFASFARDFRVPDRNGLRVTSEALAVLRRLDGDDVRGHLLVSQDERLSYLAIAETRLRSWIGHPLETPDYEAARREVDLFFDRGVVPPAWFRRPLVVVRYRREPGQGPEEDLLPHALGWSTIYESRKFQILQNDRVPFSATP